MLARAAMPVVFVLAEKIRRGTDLFGNGGRNDYGFYYVRVFLKSATVTIQQGKPCWWNAVNPSSGKPKLR